MKFYIEKLNKKVLIYKRLSKFLYDIRAGYCIGPHLANIRDQKKAQGQLLINSRPEEKYFAWRPIARLAIGLADPLVRA